MARVHRWRAVGCLAGVVSLGCGNAGERERTSVAEETGGIVIAPTSTEETAGSTFDPGDSFGKLDVGGWDTELGGGGDCAAGGGSDEVAYSIIWIANSAEGTVSKIDTRTARELARYRTGPGEDDPSRTSVNLVGDVAIANRHGSVTKIASVERRCVDADGDGAIRTSQGPDDVLPWGEDECVLWHHPTDFADPGANQGGPRAIAWDGGTREPGSCLANPRLWFAWRDVPREVAIVRHLDGRTGEVLGEVEIEDWVGNWGHGLYGGASDADGAFWGLGTLGTLVRVEPGTLDVTRWDNPDSQVLYGIALDADGNPWLAAWGGNLYKFDRETEAFLDMGGVPDGPTRMRGLAIDERGHAWLAGNETCALVRFDTVTEEVLDAAIPLPGCSEPVGVSIDADGMVWVVDRRANQAYRVDPTDYAVDIVDGLVSPYTYSDMTGAGLGLVIRPPTG